MAVVSQEEQKIMATLFLYFQLPQAMKLLTAILLLLSLNTYGQDDLKYIPKVNGEYGYEDVMPVDTGSKKEKLYDRAKLYFVDAFKSAKDVIQYDNKEEGKIIGKGFIPLVDKFDAFLSVTLVKWSVYYTTEIIVKDGRYKYRLYDIRIHETQDGELFESNNLSLQNAYDNTKKGGMKKMYKRLLNKLHDQFELNVMAIYGYLSGRMGRTAKDQDF